MSSNNVVGSGSEAGGEDRWQLSAYDNARRPFPAMRMDIPAHLSDPEVKAALEKELTCPICLDILRQTLTAKECLHRFCAECITTALRSGNKECPSCRKRLVSRRSLRSDKLYDELVACFYPERRRECGSPPSSTASSSSRKRKSPQPKTPVKRATNIDARVYPCEACQFSILCRNLADEEQKVERYLKTQSKASISHLKRYIRLQYPALFVDTANDTVSGVGDDDDAIDNKINLYVNSSNNETNASAKNDENRKNSLTLVKSDSRTSLCDLAPKQNNKQNDYDLKIYFEVVQ